MVNDTALFQHLYPLKAREHFCFWLCCLRDKDPIWRFCYSLYPETILPPVQSLCSHPSWVWAQTDGPVAHATRTACPQLEANLIVFRKILLLKGNLSHYFIILVNVSTVPTLQFQTMKQDYSIHCQTEKAMWKIISNRKVWIHKTCQKNPNKQQPNCRTGQ